MAAEKDIIVALELATTSIRAIAGQRLSDGTMQVLAFAEENSSHCIRKGIIDNIDKTTQAISRVLGQIGLQLGQTISRVYVGLSGQSLHSKLNRIQRTFTEKTQIGNTLIDQLMDTNRGMVYTDSEILEVVPQEYRVGNRTIPDIVGIQAEQIEANFLNIIARNSLAENIEKCINDNEVDIAELLITPIALGDSILNASEKRSGCALVDIGADTTTVSIYTHNILRKLVVLPLGSNNVTMDIANCVKTEADEAESLKLKYGYATIDNPEEARANTIKISHGREKSEAELGEIIEARYEEILRNVWAQIKDDSNKLTSGIVFTGGGAQIRAMEEAFQKIMTNDRQMRIVKGLPTDISLATGVFVPDNGRTNSILALLLHGEQNCITRTENTTAEPIVEENASTGGAASTAATATVSTDEKLGIEESSQDTPEPEEKEKKQPLKGFFEILKKALIEDDDE